MKTKKTTWMMYGCTTAAALWFTLGCMTELVGPFVVCILFCGLSWLYWAQS